MVALIDFKDPLVEMALAFDALKKNLNEPGKPTDYDNSNSAQLHKLLIKKKKLRLKLFTPRQINDLFNRSEYLEKQG